MSYARRMARSMPVVGRCSSSPSPPAAAAAMKTTTSSTTEEAMDGATDGSVGRARASFRRPRPRSISGWRCGRSMRGGATAFDCKNALDALDESSSLASTTTTTNDVSNDGEKNWGGVRLSVRRAAGLVRCAAFLLDDHDALGG